MFGEGSQFYVHLIPFVSMCSFKIWAVLAKIWSAYNKRTHADFGDNWKSNWMQEQLIPPWLVYYLGFTFISYIENKEIINKVGFFLNFIWI